MSAAICYAASSGYLFQTTLSALQVRAQSGPQVRIIVVYLGSRAADDEEPAKFAKVLARHDVELVHLGPSGLMGLPPAFGRYFIDLVLPSDIERILYLDGDTQVLGNLVPLLLRPLVTAGIAACLDPMVLLHSVDRGRRARIERWWRRAGIPATSREGYVNSGVMLLDRQVMPGLRSRMTEVAKRNPSLVFPDQDALNIVCGADIQRLSMRWNFPGFMVGTPVEEEIRPQVVHFMSEPRPWSAPYAPWGQRFHLPYVDLVAVEPSLRPYWRRDSSAAITRYSAQQLYKSLTERRVLLREATRMAVRDLETDLATRPVSGDDEA